MLKVRALLLIISIEEETVTDALLFIGLTC